eukprot:203633-Chlamydomonas_euryale.AAC.2
MCGGSTRAWGRHSDVETPCCGGGTPGVDAAPLVLRQRACVEAAHTSGDCLKVWSAVHTAHTIPPPHDSGRPHMHPRQPPPAALHSH